MSPLQNTWVGFAHGHRMSYIISMASFKLLCDEFDEVEETNKRYTPNGIVLCGPIVSWWKETVLWTSHKHRLGKVVRVLYAMHPIV